MGEGKVGLNLAAYVVREAMFIMLDEANSYICLRVGGASMGFLRVAGFD
jgi:hypothetical protein